MAATGRRYQSAFVRQGYTGIVLVNDQQVTVSADGHVTTIKLLPFAF
jgi:hypothetical protein